MTVESSLPTEENSYLDVSNVYPSLKELFGSTSIGLTRSLATEIEERYKKYGGKYLTGKLHEDGRAINGCMDANSAHDALEEIVDAEFNLLVLAFKGHRVSHLIFKVQELYESLLFIENAIKDGEDGSH